MSFRAIKVSFVATVVFLWAGTLLALPEDEIQEFQNLLALRPVGERIAFWAERFIGVPYDRDPLGQYVSKAVVVVDDSVDCMYLTFRTVELALSRSPEEAIQVALEKRFRLKGILKGGKVLNYEDRFQYGEDMIFSGKWGKEVSGEIGKTIRIRGSRGRDFVEVVPPAVLSEATSKLKSGDIIFFVKAPEERRVGEIVGHIGILTVEKDGSVYLVHASGTKERGGMVRKVPLKEYLSQMPFIGVKVTRFD